jgi:hypothetical protein
LQLSNTFDGSIKQCNLPQTHAGWSMMEPILAPGHIGPTVFLHVTFVEGASLAAFEIWTKDAVNYASSLTSNAKVHGLETAIEMNGLLFEMYGETQSPLARKSSPAR